MKGCYLVELIDLLATETSPTFQIVCTYINGVQPQFVMVNIINSNLNSFLALFQSFDNVLNCQPGGFFLKHLNKMQLVDLEMLSSFNFFKFVNEFRIYDSFSESTFKRIANLQNLSFVKIAEFGRLADSLVSYGDPYRYTGAHNYSTLSIIDTNIVAKKCNYLIDPEGDLA